MPCRSSIRRGGCIAAPCWAALALGALALFNTARAHAALGEEDPADDGARRAKLNQALDKIAAAIRPPPAPAIPEDPPPCEGAMFDLPYVIEPPDFLLVEVLEALPGRPISGMRLVRPDGTITLGMYGDVYVRGLTPTQAKAKIVLHLRRFLNYEVLGLIEGDEDQFDMAPAAEPGAAPVPAPERPGGGRVVPLDRPAAPPPVVQPPLDRRAPLGRSSASAAPGRAQPPVLQNVGARVGNITRTSQGRAGVSDPRVEESAVRSALEVAMQPPPQRPPGARAQEKPKNSPKPAPRAGGAAPAVRPDQAPPRAPQSVTLPQAPEGYRYVLPEKTSRVYVDIDSYNSKAYYVYGDVGLPGKYPWTGNETVLDALSYVGGMVATAEPKDMVLVRSSRFGRPARVYKLDWDAIMNKGEAKANLQLFPGDRIVVGRNAVVKATVEMNRLAEPVSLITNQMLTYAFLMRSLGAINNPYNGTTVLTPDSREAMFKDLIDFWLKATGPAGARFDNTTIRDELTRPLEKAKQGSEAPQPKPEK